MGIEKQMYPVSLPDEGESIEVALPLLPGQFEEEDFEEPIVIPHDANLADFIPDDELKTLAMAQIMAYEADETSREEWKKAYINGIDLLGLKYENRTKPWAGASGVSHPLLAESVVKFLSQTIQEIFPAAGPVKSTVVGRITTEKTAQAKRVQNYMNYVATKQMVEYRDETEKLLFSLPIAGSAFRKVYQDPDLKRPCSMFVPAPDFVVAYGTANLETCGRATHIMRKSANDVRKLQFSGFYADVDLPQPVPEIAETKEKEDKTIGVEVSYDTDDHHTLLEQVVDLDLTGFEDLDDEGTATGIALPYVLTMEKGSAEVLSIRRNWKEGDTTFKKRQHFIQYQYLPGLGFYGFGLVHIIGGLSKAATSLLRQLIDAGSLANLPAGLKTRGLKIKGDDKPMMPGEFRDVDVPAGTIKDNLTFLPYKEPSSVLYQLLGDLVAAGQKFASAADVKASDMNTEAPVGTTLAILEREMKVMSAVQARVHNAMGKEIQILAEIIKDFAPEKYPYEVEGDFTIWQDFDDRVDIIPVSDPNAGTMAQRIMQYQAALQLAQTAPQIYDVPLLHRQMLEVLGIENAEKLVPLEADLMPTDPVTENMAILNGEPVKAHWYQDHEAHIQTHIAMAKDPEVMEIMKMNPQAQVAMAAGAAHITEHLAFAYRRRLEQELGMELPSPDEPMPEDIELRLSRLVAPAAAQLTGKAQQQQQAEENAEKQKDPIIMQAEEELRIKEASREDKAREAQGKIEAGERKANEVSDDKDKDRASKEKIAFANLAQKREDSSTKATTEGFKTGYAMVRDVTNKGKDGSS